MSSSHNFEVIVDGQFPPTVEIALAQLPTVEWYEYGLNFDFGELNGKSILGNLAINLTMDVTKAHRSLEETQRRFPDIRPMLFNIDDESLKMVDEADKDFASARAWVNTCETRYGAFERLYLQTIAEIQKRQADNDNLSPREILMGAIVSACAQTRDFYKQTLSDDPESLNDVENLIEVAGVSIELEADRHFTVLLGTAQE